MRKGLFGIAWKDVKASPGWFGKILILSVLYFISFTGMFVVSAASSSWLQSTARGTTSSIGLGELAIISLIFGVLNVISTIILNGYTYGWAREIAWNIQTPMPQKIIYNNDGTFWKRGVFIFVLSFVLSFVVNFVFGLINAVVGNNAGLTTLFGIIQICVLIAVMVWTWVGGMRIAIYNEIGPGFQWDKVWTMVQKEGSSLAGIIGVWLLFIVLVVIIATFLFMGVITSAVTDVLPQLYSSNSSSLLGGNTSITAREMDIIATALVGKWPLFLIVSFLVCIPLSLLQVIFVRALGYWTRNFNVAAWGAPTDPLPFEVPGYVDPFAAQDISMLGQVGQVNPVDSTSAAGQAQNNYGVTQDAQGQFTQTLDGSSFVQPGQTQDGVAQQSQAAQPAQSFDTQTGLPLNQTSAQPAQNFDTQTGQPLNAPVQQAQQPVQSTPAAPAAPLGAQTADQAPVVHAEMSPGQQAAQAVEVPVQEAVDQVKDAQEDAQDK